MKEERLCCTNSIHCKYWLMCIMTSSSEVPNRPAESLHKQRCYSDHAATKISHMWCRLRETEVWKSICWLDNHHRCHMELRAQYCRAINRMLRHCWELPTLLLRFQADLQRSSRLSEQTAVKPVVGLPWLRSAWRGPEGGREVESSNALLSGTSALITVLEVDFPLSHERSEKFPM